MPALPFILLAAVIQGWSLYGLHHSLEFHHWPATSQAWLMALPFAQNRLATGRWSIQYPALFANAWRNKLTLAEAALFTALFWLLLFLWQMLFHMLGIDYFRELFREPIFVYPVTSLTFGCALHLIGSIERLTAVVLEQLLNVLKWLGILAGAILVFFTVALVFKLPGLVFTGQKAIGAAWLLWLMAVVVLLLNAAFRDGSVSQPYPKWVARFLRMAVPLTVIISATAFYALMMRSQRYGLTVERVWALIVAGAALLYAVGYARAAFGSGAWFAGIARVNVIAALVLMLFICAALTPLLSPYRLAANSQFRIVRERGLLHAESEQLNPHGIMQDTPLQYLRFDSGNYGRAKLLELAEVQSGPDAENTRLSAKRLLAQKARWEAPPAWGAAAVAAAVAKLRIYPAGRTLDQNLNGVLTADLSSPSTGFVFRNVLDRAAGLYIDLNRDNSEEFVFLTDSSGLVYEHRAGQWVRVGSLYADRSESSGRYGWDLFGQLAKGNMAATPPKWNDLSIGDQKFKVNGH